jgi:uncharacterized protein (DUF488 family)
MPGIDDASMQVWTVGHSTHAFEAFLALPAGHGIEQLADIRTVPKSHRHPQFHTETLARSLPAAGVRYQHVALLGGWRRPAADSPNPAWRNRSFRGYADYALTLPFAAGLAELRALAATGRTAMMCSEALWWRCHRRLVADRLVAGDDLVWHIGSDGRVSPHALTPFATVTDDGRVIYSAAPSHPPPDV